MDKEYTLQLMHKDTLVLEYKPNELCSVVNEELIPFMLKGSIDSFTVALDDIDIKDAKIFLRKMIKANDILTAWLANRVLPLTRKNAKKIYNIYCLSQSQSPFERAKIAIMCRAVSLLDDYWIKVGTDTIKWEEVNLRHRQLNEVITQVALRGTVPRICGRPTITDTPELTTNGAYAKAWQRAEDGTLWLYKMGAHDTSESRIEVMVSNLLDKCNVEHVHYEMDDDCCKCPCITTDELSIIPAEDFITYCNQAGLSPDKEMFRIDADGIYKMWIVDYLIANRDRHSQNWGFFVDSDTNKVLKCHPLFDHNNAFDVDYMQNPDSSYQAVASNKTMRECAQYAMKKVDFHFTAPITREDFITDRQYKCFTGRAKELGIKTVLGQESMTAFDSTKG